MIKVILFSLLAIGLGSCDRVLEADQLYEKLFQTGDPLFVISKDDAQLKFFITKHENALVFQSDVAHNGVTFKFNEKEYILSSFKLDFAEEDASVEILFTERNPSNAPTNIAIKTVISPDPDKQGKNGVTAIVVPEDILDMLINRRNRREKSANMNIKWIAEFVTNKKPQFHDISRGPATLQFVSPPIIINASEFTKLSKLKDHMKATLAQQLLNFVGSSTGGLIGSSRNHAA